MFATLLIIVVLLMPMPTFVLDMLLAFNLGFSILILLVTLKAKHSMELAVFPSLLLLSTLFRLSLNVATTRLILLNGNAGKMVSTFGDMMVGGSLVVGVVVFLILVIIQFIVITKGASRISEVNARFMLDSIPGKQMAIDSDLNHEVIDEHQAKAAREALAKEAEFIGAMDGAGKYVRGDSIAGLIITAINLVGGITIGMMNGGGFSESIEKYSILTIGDGLISQIPALIIATTAGLLITKASSDVSLGNEVQSQLFSKRQPVLLGGIILLSMSVVPGMPTLTFMILGGGLVTAYFTMKDESQIAAEKAAEEEENKRKQQLEQEKANGGQNQEVDIADEFIRNERIVVEIGTDLIPANDATDENGMMKRLSLARRTIAKENGIWVPKIRVRDNVEIPADAYRILINNRQVGEGELKREQFLMIKNDDIRKDIPGTETLEPAFKLPALWVEKHQAERAARLGFMVFDPITVLATHLKEVLTQYAAELFSREDLNEMLTKIEASSKSIVEEVRKGDLIRPAMLWKVFLHLLEERVPIRSVERIIESSLEHAMKAKTTEELTEFVRADLGAAICEPYLTDDRKTIQGISVDEELQEVFISKIYEGRLAVSIEHIAAFAHTLKQIWENANMQSITPILLVSEQLRRPLRSALLRFTKDIPVLAYPEIPHEIRFAAIGNIPVNIIATEQGNPTPTPNQAGERPIAA